MKYLSLNAGATALAQLNKNGLSAEMFSIMLGASGGPKWFTLYGLDRYLFSSFFDQRKTPLHIIGSSAGAFRFAALAQANPVSAIERLATHYANIEYSAKPSIDEISHKGELMLDELLGDSGVNEILNNPYIHPHFVTAKTSGLLRHEFKPAQLLGLSKSYLLNLVKRRYLAKQYQRVNFTTAPCALSIEDQANITTSEVGLTRDNLKDALLASGSIPMLLKGIKDIAHAPQGTYRDGGIIDYHFDLSIKLNAKLDGLILYPHFSSQPRAGWFDKNLSRTPLASSYDNVLMLTPTQAFIDTLPYQKIPDRKDFTELSPPQRIAYWQKVLERSELLAAEFASIVEKQSLSEIKPLTLR